MDDRREQLEQLFGGAEYAGHVEHSPSMPCQHFDVYVCRKPKFGRLEEIWAKVKRWDQLMTI
jgi:hypothetical protein